jgi:hypothetical protein
MGIVSIAINNKSVVKNVVSNVLSSPSFIIYCYGDNSHLDGEYQVTIKMGIVSIAINNKWRRRKYVRDNVLNNSDIIHISPRQISLGPVRLLWAMELVLERYVLCHCC